MKVLVTGATGFLGSRIVESLIKLNEYDITATGRDQKRAEKLKEGVPKDTPLQVITGSLEEKEFAEKISEGADFIIHSAALSSPWGKYQEFQRANIMATENILSACKKNKVRRLVHISTPSIYFDYNDRFDIKEDFLPAKFVNYYAETKYKAEKLIDKASEGGLEAISLRPRAIVGAGDTTIMPRLLKAQEAGKLKIIGDGKNIVDVTSVSNVLDAVILSLKAPKEALGHKYNITNGDPIALWELVSQTFERLNLTLNRKKIPFVVALNVARVLETIAKISPGYQEPVLTCYGVGILAKSMTMNIDKAKTLLGYQPRQKNLEAVDEFVNWWKSGER
jgi:nucleoside-diphosphate-sugar epimerase